MKNKSGIGSESLESAMAAGTENFETAFRAGADAAAKGYEKAFAMAQEHVQKASAAAFKSYDEVAELSKENVEALVKSGTVLAKGWEDFGKAWFATGNKSAEATVAAAQTLLKCKTVREMVDANTSLAREGFETFVTETTRLSELSARLANEAFEPIGARVNVAVDKVFKARAA